MMHETYRIERLASDTTPKHWSEWMTQITSRDNEILAGEKLRLTARDNETRRNRKRHNAKTLERIDDMDNIKRIWNTEWKIYYHLRPGQTAPTSGQHLANIVGRQQCWCCLRWFLTSKMLARCWRTLFNMFTNISPTLTDTREWRQTPNILTFLQLTFNVMFSFSCHLTSFLMNVGEMLARCCWVNANGTNIVGQHVGQMLARCWRSLPRP